MLRHGGNDGKSYRIMEFESRVIRTSPITSSNKDIGLISVFESNEALQNYQVHPAHVTAAKYIGSVTEGRVCLDYEA